MSLVNSREEALLKARHFKGGAAKLDQGGLRFDELIGHDDRYVWNTGACISDKRLERFEDRHTRVVLNPSLITPPAPLRMMTEAHKRADRAWKVARDDGFLHEGQELIAVAYAADKTPVGYATFSLNVTREDESKEITLHVNVDYFFVRPEFRGQVYGFDLAAAVIWICHDVLEAIYHAAPAGSTIETVLYADLVSGGGEKIVRSIESGLSANTDSVRDCASPQRGDVEIGEVTFDEARTPAGL
jgi:GNAT superfamily N-acetyltransferase